MIRTFIICLTLFAAMNGFSQDFLDGSFTFSTKKPAYLTLADGKEITGFITDIDRKKGLIKKIELKDSTGKKMQFLPEQLQYMYLAPTGWDKFTRSMEQVNDFSKWDRDQTINKAYIKDGYVRFEQAAVIIKKDTLNLLLQLVNPGYASRIRVYFDPYASESASMSIGGMEVSGGDVKSYYVKKMNDTAYKLEKKNYKKQVAYLYGDCPGFSTSKDKDWKWSEFSQDLFLYTKECGTE